LLLQSRVAATQDRTPGDVSAQIWPLPQHTPLQHEALPQQTPPQITVPRQPSQQHLPLIQVSFTWQQSS
jgi:hypothetical protein